MNPREVTRDAEVIDSVVDLVQYFNKCMLMLQDLMLISLSFKKKSDSDDSKNITLKNGPPFFEKKNRLITGLPRFPQS